MLLDHRHRGVTIHISHDNHGHQVRPVPVAIEAHELLALRTLDDRRLPDRWPIRVARSFELRALDLVARTLTRAKVHAPFGQDDAALVFEGALVECGGVGPVLQDEHRAIEYA